MHSEQFGVLYVVQGHFDVQTGGAGGQISNPLISKGPVLPPEPIFSLDGDKIRGVCIKHSSFLVSIRKNHAVMGRHRLTHWSMNV